MDQATLVNSDIEIEGKVVSALSSAQIPVTAVDWNWVPQLDEFRIDRGEPLGWRHGDLEKSTRAY